MTLVSVGSRDTEYDLKTINDQAVSVEVLDTNMKIYYLNNSKRVISVKDGTAVNFILPSIPVEILDLVFSEILNCIVAILKEAKNENSTYKPGNLYQLNNLVLDQISKDWLRYVNQQ